ncbi:LLM class flavin-dependent oxidoreductase [Tessaracoccus lubricantis]|uniref:LLM class flavin-dependent oxidoreductase n=1 Tax=Tessaracoccus lubricantis TaxID=545543 RepID=A0ABP9F512_9ACTN
MDIDALEFGIDTFGDITADADGTLVSHDQVVRNVVEEGVLADRVGLHAIGIGEHHRDDFAVSSPEMVLAAIAARTEHIKLASAVTVLSSDDPVRVFERFATLDAISSGRAEIVVGRGSFTESFPLFGYNLRDYEELFEEKLALFAQLIQGGRHTWEGKHTQDLKDVELFPKLAEGPLKTWVAVGGSPQSVVRAASYGLPLMLAIIGGPTARFAPFAELHRRALQELGKEPQPIGYHSYGHVAPTDEEALEQLYPAWLEQSRRIGGERGWGHMGRDHFDNEAAHGSMAAGSPETVARKIADGMKALGATRYQLKVSAGRLSHEAIMRSIELYGTEVVPLVKDMLADS